MDKPHKKFRVIGERRTELDIARFASALIAFALHRLRAESEDTPAQAADSRHDREEAS
jgi:hypothetical protein